MNTKDPTTHESANNPDDDHTPRDYTTFGIKEAAAFLHISPSSLYARANDGTIPGAKVGKKWVFLREDLAAHIRASYPPKRHALRVTTLENTQCHSTNETAFGGLHLPRQTERVYDALLEPETNN